MGAISVALVSATALWEGTKYDPYYDLANILTVCNGHTGNDIIKNKRYTPLECKALLEKDLKVHRAEMFKCVTVPLTPYQADSFTLFTINVGGRNFCTSTSVLKKLNAGDYKGACDGLLKWSYVKGKYVQGLNNRRQYERNMCLGLTK